MRNKEIFNMLETYFKAIYGEEDLKVQYEYDMGKETDKTRFLLKRLIESHKDQRDIISGYVNQVLKKAKKRNTKYENQNRLRNK